MDRLRRGGARDSAGDTADERRRVHGGDAVGTKIHYEDRDGQSNDLSISRGAASLNFPFEFREDPAQEDPGVTIAPDPLCAPVDDYLATCSAVDFFGNPIVRVTVSLGVQDDRLTSY